jgi:ankyrin repeat protein
MRTGRIAVGFCVIALFLVTETVRGGVAALADAAMRKDISAVRALLQEKADVNAPQADGTTALEWAVRSDDLEMAQLLIRAGANVKTTNRLGVTSLELACINGNAAIVEALLKAGADPNAPLSEIGETALMMAARTGNPDAVKVLLDHGADVNAKESSKEQTALMWAASERHAAVVKLLIEHDADVNARSKSAAVSGRGLYDGANTTAGAAKAAAPPTASATNAPATPARSQRQAGAGGPQGGAVLTGGITALMLASRENSLDSAKLLVGAGANVNTAMANGSNALLMAILNGHYELATFLINNGANPNLVDKDGKAALYAAVEMRNLATTDTPGPVADKADALALIKTLLEHGADPNSRLTGKPPFRGGANRTWLTEPGATPFYRAAASNDVASMRLLLAYGADPSISATDNSTPLMVAAGVGYLTGSTFTWPEADAMEALRLCLQLNDVNAANSAGLTALHGAAFRGWNNAVQTLVDNGAKLDAKDKQGRTPLNWADGVYRGGGIAPVRQVETVALFQKLMK